MGFLFFAWIPPLSSAVRRRAASHSHSLLTHSLTPAFGVAGAVHRACWRSCGARGRRWPAAGFRVAGAVHRASWRSCGARGRRWPAARFRVAGAVQRASWLPFALQAPYTEPPGGAAARVSRGRRSTDVASWLPLAWQAHYTEPAGGAAARVGAAGPRLAVAWQAQYRYSFLAAFGVAGAIHRACWRSCGARGRRWPAAAFRVAGAQSLLEEQRAWAPLVRGWLSRGRRSTNSFLAAFGVAGALHRACWRSCGARGRRWPAAGCRVDLSSPLITDPLITSQLLITTHHNSSHLITYQVITAPLLTPHSSQLHCS